MLVQGLRGIGRRPRWDNQAVVLSRDINDRSYHVRLSTGETLHRNRIYLRPLNDSEEATSEDVTRTEEEAVVIRQPLRRSPRIAAKST